MGARALAQMGNSSISFKNKIINGDMKVDERNKGVSITPTVDGTYSLDRWQIRLTQASKLSVQQNAGSVALPAGFTNYLGVTSLSAYSVTSTDWFNIRQQIEGLNVADLGWGTANAKPVTVSFWVRSSLTGTFGGTVNNNAFDRSYPFTYTISSANTWEQKTVTIAGDTTGTWLTNNSCGLALTFNLGVGSSYNGPAGSWAGVTYLGATGATSVLGTSGATFYITGVQLEKGSVATPYEVLPYQVQLAQCQRYYYVDTTGNYTGAVIDSGTYSAYRSIVVPWKQTMRTTPTFTYTQSGTITSITPAISITPNSSNSIFNGVTNNFVQYTTPIASAEL